MAASAVALIVNCEVAVVVVPVNVIDAGENVHVTPTGKERQLRATLPLKLFCPATVTTAVPADVTEVFTVVGETVTENVGGMTTADTVTVAVADVRPELLAVNV